MKTRLYAEPGGGSARRSVVGDVAAVGLERALFGGLRDTRVYAKTWPDEEFMI